MATVQGSRFFTLLQREFREYRNSMFWTPVITAVLLGLLMLGSVFLVNRISVFGDAMLDALMDKEGISVSISTIEDESTPIPITVIDLDREESGGKGADGAGEDIELDYQVTVGEGKQQSGKLLIRQSGDAAAVDEEPAGETSALPQTYQVVVEDEESTEPWNFSRDWRFNPVSDDKDEEQGGTDQRDLDGRELNPMLSVVHGILLLILLLTSGNYLLGSLYEDRKDRSILFWRSMPVSEWQLVASKFVTAIVVTPMLYIAISILLQLAYVLLMMVLVWRMGESPADAVLANLDFVALMTDPIGGWILTALWIAPLYAWLLLASAAAKRSPFLMALVPVLALVVGEFVFFGSDHVSDAVQNHIPHVSETSAVGFYLFGPDWSGIDLLSMGAGLLFTAAALAGAVWLRRHRWEL